MSAQISALLERVLQSPRRHVRRVIAIAGPPASGKSTLAAGLVAALQQAGVTSQLVPMDGFHLDNSVLTDRGILDRKGSPPSFDAIGLLRLVQVLGAAQELSPLGARLSRDDIVEKLKAILGSSSGLVA